MLWEIENGKSPPEDLKVVCNLKTSVQNCRRIYEYPEELADVYSVQCA
jgi:hypothetical protein